MQDYNYIWGSCMEITLELSCCKFPHHYELPKFWMDNKQALLRYIGEVHRGVRGFILDPNGNAVPRANLKIKGRNVGFKSSKVGEFWRILLPGVYTMEVYADGYNPTEKQFHVNEGQPTLINVQLTPLGFVSTEFVNVENSSSDLINIQSKLFDEFEINYTSFELTTRTVNYDTEPILTMDMLRTNCSKSLANSKLIFWLRFLLYIAACMNHCGFNWY